MVVLTAKIFSDVQKEPPVQPLVLSVQQDNVSVLWDKILLSTAETSLKIKLRFPQYFML